MKKIYILLFIGFALNLSAQKVDTIRVGHKFKAIKDLELGKTKDIIYTKVGERIMSVSIKMKETKIVSINNQDYLSFTHNWHSGKPEESVSFEYICDTETLKPIQHIRVSEKVGKEAFSFDGLQITGLDSVASNAQQDFSMDLTEPTYNWEIDLETYSLLPMKKGYHALMNFYHPGSQFEPKFYHLKVTGSEMIKLPNGKSIDCWVVYTDYGGTQPSRFWYTKKGQNFVKMEGKYNQLTILKERIF